MITVSEDTLTKMNVPVTTIANRAMDRAFSEIAAGFEEIGLPVTGDIAPEEVVHMEDQFVEYVCMMAVNNPTLARLDGARTPDLVLAEQHFERCARALREAITAFGRRRPQNLVYRVSAPPPRGHHRCTSLARHSTTRGSDSRRSA